MRDLERSERVTGRSLNETFKRGARRFHDLRTPAFCPDLWIARLPILPRKQTSRRQAGLSQSAMCGRLRVGKSFFHILQHWSVQPCVRPFNAVHMTAGHNALRGSGPDQQLAFKNAMAHVGCPDHRIDRLCITCCSPSQPSRRASCPARFRSSRKREGFLVSLAPCHHGPDHSGDLVGERDSRNLGRPPC